ncbi:unnamed protein product, partial [Prunus brigantina]
MKQYFQAAKILDAERNLNAMVAKRNGGDEEGSSLQVSPMVLLNSLRVIPPKILWEKVIAVFVDVFAMEPSEIFIDASLVHGGMLIEAIENMEPNWDLKCGLEEMQLVALVHCLNT